jgi:hypothetical protein
VRPSLRIFALPTARLHIRGCRPVSSLTCRYHAINGCAYFEFETSYVRIRSFSGLFFRGPSKPYAGTTAVLVDDLDAPRKFTAARSIPLRRSLPCIGGIGPNKAPTKKLVSLRLSGQVLEAYKAKGPGSQSRIDGDRRRIHKIR